MDRELMWHHLWNRLVVTITDANQGMFMHISWLFVGCLTLGMTAVAVARLTPSLRARRLKKSIAQQQPLARHVAPEQASEPWLEGDLDVYLTELTPLDEYMMEWHRRRLWP